LVNFTVTHDISGAIDGFGTLNMKREDVEELKLFVTEGKRIDEKKKTLIKKAATFKRYLPVWVIDHVGQKDLINWYELIQSIGFDGARLLGKGANFRVQTKKCRSYRDVWDQTFWEHYIKDDKFKKMNLCKNRIKGLHEWKNDLYNNGWIVRKEDKGCRFCLVSRQWENNQWKTAKLPIKVSTKEVKNTVPRMYFNPKTHKDESTVKGRPIVSWPRDSQKYARNVLRICKTLIDGFGFDLSSVGKSRESMKGNASEKLPLA